jgi:hypothetical protein
MYGVVRDKGMLCGCRRALCEAMCMHLYDTVETGKHADKQSKDVRTRTGLVGQVQGERSCRGYAGGK